MTKEFTQLLNGKLELSGHRASVVVDPRWMSYRVTDGPRLLVLVTVDTMNHERLYAAARAELARVEEALRNMPEHWQYAGPNEYAISTGDGNGFDDYTVWIKLSDGEWRIRAETKVGTLNHPVTYKNRADAVTAAHKIDKKLLNSIGGFMRMLKEAVA